MKSCYYSNHKPILRYIDHGNGVIGLRLADPFVFDGGMYKCVVTNALNDFSVHSICELEVNEPKTYCENSVNIIRPDFLKKPLPVVTRKGSDVSFSCRVSPPGTRVVWMMNGREITDDSTGFSVSKTIQFAAGN